MCHASQKRREVKIQSMYVDSNETIKVKKIEFVKSSLKVNSPSASCSWTDLTVINTEANVRYLSMLAYPSSDGEISLHHDRCPENHHRHVELITSLGSITKR